MTFRIQYISNMGANIALSIWYKVIEGAIKFSVLFQDTVYISRGSFLLNRMKRYLELVIPTVLRLCKDFSVQKARV